MFFQPGDHIFPTFRCHRKGILPFHLAFLIAEKPMPILHKNRTLGEVYFLGCRHHHIGLCPEAEYSAGAGKNIIHGESVQRGDIQSAFHSLQIRHQFFHFIQQLTKEGQGLIDRLGAGHVHTCALEQIDGALGAAAGQEA